MRLPVAPNWWRSWLYNAVPATRTQPEIASSSMGGAQQRGLHGHATTDELELDMYLDTDTRSSGKHAVLGMPLLFHSRMH